MQKPLFSVLIANFNNGKYIAACLDSVLNQDYLHLEIVIVDDASTDQSLAIIAPYLNQHHPIKLITNSENQGVGYTKKRCIDEASGEICGFVDPDDTITPNAVAAMVSMHQQHPEASLLYSDYYECDENLRTIGAYQSAQVVNSQAHFFNDEGKIGPFASFKKSSYQKTKGLNTYLKRAIDQDLYLKLYDVGECLHLPLKLYHYRMHANGLATKAQTNLAYYWFWVVKILRAQDKGINLEQDFAKTFVRAASLKHWIKADQLFRKSPLYKLFRFFK